jgi:transposase-like protein
VKVGQFLVADDSLKDSEPLKAVCSTGLGRIQARVSQDRSAVEERLLVENARLKRHLAEQGEELSIVKKAAAYFATSLK